MVSVLRVKSVTGMVTIQDMGRYGYRSIGVPVSGALDKTSYVYSNVLIGNEPVSAVIEIIGVFSAEALNDTIICVTGGAEKVLIDNVEYESWKPIFVEKNSTITILPGRSPLSYLGIYSGVSCNEVLGSRSTYLRGRIGCFPEGIKVGDVIESYKLPSKSEWYRVKDLTPPFNPFKDYIPGDVVELRSTRGVHSDLLWDLEVLFKNTYRLSEEYDRTGYRLEGPSLKSAEELGRLASIPVDRGYVQIPPDGKPIVLMSDSQTIGGYAVALHVVQPDLDRLAHCQPGSNVVFREINYEAAEEITREYLDKLFNPVIVFSGEIY